MLLQSLGTALNRGKIALLKVFCDGSSNGIQIDISRTGQQRGLVEQSYGPVSNWATAYRVESVGSGRAAADLFYVKRKAMRPQLDRAAQL